MGGESLRLLSAACVSVSLRIVIHRLLGFYFHLKSGGARTRPTRFFNKILEVLRKHNEVPSHLLRLPLYVDKNLKILSSLLKGCISLFIWHSAE